MLVGVYGSDAAVAMPLLPTAIGLVLVAPAIGAEQPLSPGAYSLNVTVSDDVALTKPLIVAVSLIGWPSVTEAVGVVEIDGDGDAGNETQFAP